MKEQIRNYCRECGKRIGLKEMIIRQNCPFCAIHNIPLVFNNPKKEES